MKTAAISENAIKEVTAHLQSQHAEETAPDDKQTNSVEERSSEKVNASSGFLTQAPEKADASAVKADLSVKGEKLSTEKREN